MYCTSYFVTFQHSFLQLKCTWSRVSLEFGFHCRRIVDLALLVSFRFADNAFPLKISPCKGGSGPHLVHGFLGPPKSTPKMASGSVQLFLKAQYCDSLTDRQTTLLCNNKPHLRSTLIWPTNDSRYRDIHTTSFVAIIG